MAEYSIKDIVTRIKNIQNTYKVTKAMELIASSKFKKLREKAEKVKPFLSALENSMKDISQISEANCSPYLRNREIKKVCCIVIAGDKGLAGGYNVNVFRMFESLFKEKDVSIIPIGLKSSEYFKNYQSQIITKDFSTLQNVTYKDCEKISEIICKQYLKKEFDEINIIYTEFISSIKQKTKAKRILPIVPEKKKSIGYVMCEPGIEGFLEYAVPFYLSGMLWSMVCESRASEFGARHTAMESASKNALDISDNLKLKYNRLRQSAITQEITEIVSGI